MPVLAIGAATTAYGMYNANQAQNSAKKAISSGAAQGNALLDQGYNTASNQLTQGYNTAQGYINPYIQTGQKYQGMYDDLMGINGEEARAKAQATITSDPLWTGALAQSSNAAQRALNARGLGGSGTAALAGQRVLLQNYQPMLDQYRQGGQQGFQASTASADLASRYGSESSNLTYGNAQQKAGIATGKANALAQSSIAGANSTNQAIGMGIAGFTPGWGGTTAFGNMAGAIGKGVSGVGSGWNTLWGAGASATPNVLPGGVGAYPY